MIRIDVYAGTSVGAEQESIAEEKASDAYDSMGDNTYKVYNNITDSSQKVLGGMDTSNSMRTILNSFYKTYQGIKMMSPIIIAVCEIIGWFMYFLSPYNKKFRRLGLFGFVIILPLILIFFVFGIGFINGIFLG